MKRCAILLLLFLAGCRSLENRLVFHPTPSDGGVAAPLPKPMEDVEFRTADGIKIHGRWCPHPQAKGVVLYCHGNAGNLDHFGNVARNFYLSLDRSVLIFDYPGYGRCEGKPSETGCYASAEAAYDWLTRVQNVPPERIVIAGESLGGGVATELASRRPHQALVLIRTFTSVPEVAKRYASSAAPALMVNRFDSLKRIPSCRSPIFIAQADKDQVIPYAHGEKLRAACAAPVRFLTLRGLDHVDPLPSEFYREVREFLE